VNRSIPLLVSVRDAREAEEALAGGADWIDLKEPSRGPLGAVDAPAARQAAAAIGGRATLSAAGGELLDWPEGAARSLLATPGLAYLKLGLAGCRGRAWERLLAAAAREVAERGASLVAVVYADGAAAAAPPAEDVVSVAAGLGGDWLLVDTFDKRRGALLDVVSAAALAELLALARARGLRTAVAGRLDAPQLARLPFALVDLVGVRSAACGGDRGGRVARGHVAAVCQQLDALFHAAVRAESPLVDGRSSGRFFAGRRVS
jgi:uncharacterized protein (UPF0264 family)